MSEERENTNYLRLVSLFLDVGTEAVYKIFIFSIPNPRKDVTIFLLSPDNLRKLRELKKRKVLSKKQFNILTGNIHNAEHFDISLLIILLSNLFSEIIEPPKTGWENSKPAQCDLTLGADLVRLRTHRNKIVGHLPRAKVSDHLFETFWNDLGKIFIRLYNIIDPTKESEVTQKIEMYRTRSLDQQTILHYKAELENLRDKLEDVVHLQETVEKLLAETKEFVHFFRDPPKRYSRYIRLLFEGGKFVLLAFLEKECAKQGLDLQILIKQKVKLLVTELGNCEIWSQLNKRPDQWDILVLATVVLKLFGDQIKPKKAKLIKHILDARRDYAESAMESLDEGKFASRCEHLAYSLRTLSSSLGDETEAKCTQYIDKGIDDITKDSYMDLLKVHGLKIKSLSDIYEEKMKDLKESMQKMEEAGIDLKHEHVFQLKMITLGSDEEKKKLAEKALTTVWNAALHGSENPKEFEAVRQEADKILDAINRIEGIRSGNVEQRCIILSIRCTSYRGVIGLLDYFGSTLFQEQFFDLSNELSTIFGDVLVISANLTLNSLYASLQNPAGEHTSNQVLHGFGIPIACSSAEGMHQIFHLLSEETTTNSFNKIAEELSKLVGDRISLKVIPDEQLYSGLFDIKGFASVSSCSDDVTETEQCMQASNANNCELINEVFNMLCRPKIWDKRKKYLVDSEKSSVTQQLMSLPNKAADILLHFQLEQTHARTKLKTLFFPPCIASQSLDNHGNESFLKSIEKKHQSRHGVRKLYKSCENDNPNRNSRSISSKSGKPAHNNRGHYNASFKYYRKRRCTLYSRFEKDIYKSLYTVRLPHNDGCFENKKSNIKCRRRVIQRKSHETLSGRWLYLYRRRKHANDTYGKERNVGNGDSDENLTFVESVLGLHDEISRSKLKEHETLKVDPKIGRTIEHIRTLEYVKGVFTENEIYKYFESDIGYADIAGNVGGFSNDEISMRRTHSNDSYRNESNDGNSVFSDDEIFKYFETDKMYDDFVLNEGGFSDDEIITRRKHENDHYRIGSSVENSDTAERLTFVESVFDEREETRRLQLQEHETLKVDLRTGSPIEHIRTFVYDEGVLSDDEIDTSFEANKGYDDLVVNEETIQYKTIPQESLMATGNNWALNTQSDEEREDTLLNFTSRESEYKTDKHTGAADERYICADYALGICHRHQCRNLHVSTKYPYKWQLKLSGEWIDLPESENLEYEYCSINEESSPMQVMYEGIKLNVIIQFGSDQTAKVFAFDIEEDERCTTMKCIWRRLSTSSYAKQDLTSEVKETAPGFQTQWRWYYKNDSNRWVQFQPDALQYTLELKFLGQQKQYHFFRESYLLKYKIDFTEMTQLNIETKKIRSIIRRPLFVSYDDVRNFRFAPPLMGISYFKTALPTGWVLWDMAHPFEIVLINTETEEYEIVKRKFYATMDSRQQIIEVIYRIQNHTLLQRFRQQVNVTEVPVETKCLFYATDSWETALDVCKRNIDVCATKDCAGALFTTDAYSSHSRTKPPERLMFLANVIISEYTRKGLTGNINTSDPSVFIVCDKRQCYPEYLIQYKVYGDRFLSYLKSNNIVPTI